MRQFLVRMEAVNLSASIFDTEDLSTIRGGSIACLELPRSVLNALPVRRRHEVFSGASQTVALVEVDDGVKQGELEEQLARLATGSMAIDGLPRSLADSLPHVPLIGVAVPFEGLMSEADARSVARLRRRQLAQPTIDMPTGSVSGSVRPCSIDGMRPATRSITKGEETLAVSESVAVRRRLGIDGRRSIYGREAAEVAAGLNFAESFLDIVTSPPRGLPPSLSGKMAVIKLDGNKFGNCRTEFIGASDDPGAAAARFSESVVAGRRNFLASLLASLAEDGSMFTKDGLLRFETLMWGGDESLFVLPAWKVRDVLDVIARDMAGQHWTLDGGIRLTTGYGILICSAKMPIAIAKGLAESILSSAKSLNAKYQPHDRLSLQIIESIEAPSGDIGGLRRQLYETSEDAAFAITGSDGLTRFVEVCDAITDPANGLPRSQLQWIISQKRRSETLGDPDKRTAILREAVRRSRADSDDDAARRDVERLLNNLENPVLGASVQNSFLPFQRLAELWDLLRPFPSSISAETR